MEERINFSSGKLILEGLYNTFAGKRGAIIAHPHPLYGGDMSNPVVEAVARCFNRKGISTLRFNFRGTGGSEGNHDGGVGERQDVMAAVDFLVRNGITSIQLAGYSFGAWVLAHLQQVAVEVDELIFVSPPLALLPLQDVHSMPLLKLVITGEDDEIAPAQLIRKTLQQWNPDARFEVIDYADHFYYGCFESLEDVLHNHLSMKAA